MVNTVKEASIKVNLNLNCRINCLMTNPSIIVRGSKINHNYNASTCTLRFVSV